jgi:hypothetical protein
MIRLRHKHEWWFEPTLPVYKARAPRHLLHVDPIDPVSLDYLPKRTKLTAGFAPHRKWVYYNRLHPIDAGYIVPLYTISDIGRRYGLSLVSQRYFKKYILPEPITIVRKRAVEAHHYSKFVLMTLDLVLKDLEQRGRLQFLRTYEDHIELLHTGVSWLEEHYERVSNEQIIKTEDRHGVVWL